MKNRCFRLVLAAVVAQVCLGQQTDLAKEQVRRLLKYWDWQQYWTGTNDLGKSYGANRKVEALVFWDPKHKPESVGFCSPSLGKCLFYENLRRYSSSSSMPIAISESPRAALERFVSESRRIGAKEIIPTESFGEIESAIVSVTLPVLTIPTAIQNRRIPEPVDLELLIANLACDFKHTGCKTHLMIPFYSNDDPYVPVFRQCSQCANSKPMIIFMRHVNDKWKWWHGALDYTDEVQSVKEYKNRIRQGLLREVYR